MSAAGRDRPLTLAELREHAAALAADPERWADRVHHDPQARIYEQLELGEHVEAWLICWMDDHDTGFHDHDISAVAVSLKNGAVREERLVLGDRPTWRVAQAGDVFGFEAHDIHRVLHVGAAPAVTIHVYSPPLRRMGAYEVAASGALARHSIARDEELRPREPATA